MLDEELDNVCAISPSSEDSGVTVIRQVNIGLRSRWMRHALRGAAST